MFKQDKSIFQERPTYCFEAWMARIKKLRKQDYNIVRGRTDELGCSIDLLFLEGHKTIQSSTSSAQALPDAKASVNKKDLARLRTRGSFTRPRTSANSSGITASHGIDPSEYKRVFLRDGPTLKKSHCNLHFQLWM